MPSMTTVYRAIVMIATGVIVVKGWQHYGPSTEQVKTFAVTALEKVKTQWNGTAENPAPAPAIDPRAMAPPVVAQTPPAPAEPAPIESAPQLVPLINAGEDRLDGTGATTVAPPSRVAAESGSTGVTTLLGRLHEIGGADAQVTPWGSSGQLYRCCCRAKFAESSPLARHFEAVAGEPTAAIEQVVAKVEAWRTEAAEFAKVTSP